LPPISSAHALFGQALRELRKERGIAQEGLALKSGVDRGYYGGIERGERNVSLTNILKLASALELPASAIHVRAEQIATDTQIDLAAWARDLDAERKRVRAVNAERVRNRGYLVFATDPSRGVDSAEYRHVYATEARTPNQAIAKVRPLADGRRLRAFPTTGKYRDELADARWVA
jgi:transcriptional regulator with XRE-family HTH domain